MAAKRIKDGSGESDLEKDERIPCKYGANCYQKNPKHHEKFKHPKREESAKSKRKRESEEEEEIENDVARKKRNETEKGDASSDTESDSDDSDPVLPSPEEVKENIKLKFLVDMPDDFYYFWDFCKSLDSCRPEAVLEPVGLLLAGPFDVLSGKLKNFKASCQSDYLTYCRYYYDLPEFQTVIVKGNDDSQFHLGYFRDSPNELPVFVAANSASHSCTMTTMGENLFAAVNLLLIDKIAETKGKAEKSKLENIQDALQCWAEKEKCSLEKKTASMKARDKKTVAKGFHGAGIVVPYDKKTEVGYRPLPESDANLKKILQAIVNCKTEQDRDFKFNNLQEIITLVQFANDECDYGMGLELAVNLFCFGDPLFHPTISCLLPVAYKLLRRPQFAKICQAHLKNRSKTLYFVTPL